MRSIRKCPLRHDETSRGATLTNQEPPEPDTLSPLVRHTLLALLRQRPATAADLQEAVAEPLRTLNYHLQVMVKDRWLLAERTPEGVRYRVAPDVEKFLPFGTAGVERVIALSFLDATWAALGQKPEAGLTPVWKAYSVDDAGLLEASEIVRGCLMELGRVVSESQRRDDFTRDGSPRHRIVMVATLVPQPGEET
jgi:hypothetical protein